MFETIKSDHYQAATNPSEETFNELDELIFRYNKNRLAEIFNKFRADF